MEAMVFPLMRETRGLCYRRNEGKPRERNDW